VNAQSLERAFSFERLALLARNRLYEEAPVVGIGAAIVFGINLIGIATAGRAPFNHIGNWQVNGAAAQASAWTWTIVAAGLILAGMALKGVHGKTGTDWILLPATPLEKYGAALLDCVFLFPVAAAVGGGLMSGLLSLAERLAGGSGGSVWLPWGLATLEAWGKYAIAAAVLLAGSATFRKSALLKTLGVAIAYCMLVSLLLSLGLWSFGDRGADAGFTFGNGFYRASGLGLSPRAGKVVEIILGAGSYALLPAFAVLFGAAKVAEKEGRDEVQ
jgi:hypothetical protein